MRSVLIADKISAGVEASPRFSRAFPEATTTPLAFSAVMDTLSRLITSLSSTLANPGCIIPKSFPSSRLVPMIAGTSLAEPLRATLFGTSGIISPSMTGAVAVIFYRFAGTGETGPHLHFKIEQLLRCECPQRFYIIFFNTRYLKKMLTRSNRFIQGDGRAADAAFEDALVENPFG